MYTWHILAASKAADCWNTACASHHDLQPNVESQLLMLRWQLRVQQANDISGHTHMHTHMHTQLSHQSDCCAFDLPVALHAAAILASPYFSAFRSSHSAFSATVSM